MKTQTIKTPAKINLSLEIIKRLPNGFHQLRMVVLKLPNLHDEITFKFSKPKKEKGKKKKGNQITIQCNNEEVPTDEKNLCYQAAWSFFEKTRKKGNLEIIIKKNIPMAAGLGGGSSDAAATLLALNKHYGKPLSQKSLIKLASYIGKDIPLFFTKKNTALIEGMGEKIGDNFNVSSLYILLVNPAIHVSTGWAYKELSKELWYMQHKERENYSRLLIKALKRKDKKLLAQTLFNDFEYIIPRHFPAIMEAKQALKALGAIGSLMSGSGSTVFGVFDSKRKLKTAKKLLEKKYPDYFIAVG